MLADQYLQEMGRLVKHVSTTQKDLITKAASVIADSIEKGGVFHVFGSGHSHIVAEDVFHRAGGLINVNAMLEESLMELNVGRATRLERLSGYANVLLSGYDLRADEVILVVSNSGINSVPIEMAMECKKRGMTVMVLTNMEHSNQATSRHSSGKKLYEIADLVLDNGGVYGDAVLSYGDSSKKIGATSTIGGLLVIQTLVVAVVDELISRNVEPPVLVSANTEGGDHHNKKLISRYNRRIRYLSKY